MDRNLGARDENRSADGKGVLYYQFGRKDPFGTDGATSRGTNAYLGREEIVYSRENILGPMGIVSSVKHPLSFYTNASGNWASDVSSESYVWLDYEAEGSTKSIFDPSPRGWKVPINGVWDGFDLLDDVGNMTGWVYVEESDNIGRSYPRETPIAYYPAQGQILPSGGLGEFSNAFWLYSSTAHSATLSYFIQGRTFHTKPSNIHYRAYGFNVRPVQHYE